MTSHDVLGSLRREHEPDRPGRAGRLGIGWRLRHLPIRTRLFLGIGLLTLVAIAGGIVGFRGLRSLNSLLAAMNDDDRAMVHRLAEAHAEMHSAMKGLEGARAAGDVTVLTGLLVRTERATRLLDRMVTDTREREQRLAEEGRRRYRAAVTWMIALMGLAVSLGLGLAFLYNRVVTRPLVSLVSAVERVAAGDLSVSLHPRSRDEIGQVALATGRMVERLRAAGAQMLQHERLRTLREVSASVAHKFNNLLAVTLGQAELLQRDLSSSAEGLETIRRAALEGRDMVRRLQHFTRGGVFHEEPAQVAPRQIVGEVIAAVMPAWEARARECGVRYEVREEYGDVPNVLVQVSALTEVLQNLFLNALEAMPAGGCVRIRVATDHQHVLFAVSDTGEGIPPEVRHRIFDPFFTTKAAPASGLGLSICSRIMLSLQGTVEVESVLRRGTTATVRLPLPRSQGGRAASAAPPSRVLPWPARILVIDDESRVADTLARLLREAGHVVETAPSGSVGIERYRQRRFDCVLTDLLMPGLTGLTVGRAIRDQDPDAHVILLTAQADLPDPGQMVAAGVDRIVTKPVSREQLLSLFERSERTAETPFLETSCRRP